MVLYVIILQTILIVTRTDATYFICIGALDFNI